MSLMIWLFTQAHFFDTKDQGWHFYHDAVVNKPEDQPPKTLKELKERVSEFLDKAIWDPTPKNVLRYQRTQKLVIDKSQKFAEVWAQTLLQQPELDNTLVAPPSYYGALHNRHMKQTTHQMQLKINAKEYGLVLLIDNGPTSTALQEVVTNMADYRGYELMVLNGTDVMRQWGIKRLPALKLVNLSSGRHHLITYGLIGADEMEERMVQVMA